MFDLITYLFLIIIVIAFVYNLYIEKCYVAEYNNAKMEAISSMDEALKYLKENDDSIEKSLQAQTKSIEMIKESLLLQKEGNKLLREILLVLKNS